MESKINCMVENCKHNENACNCVLNSITVGKTASAPSAKKDTECDSFECC